MARGNDMAARLPPVYREGELVRNLLGLFAVHIETLLEDANEVQRAHFWHAALERDEVARLAAVLDFVAESWQGRDAFRAWVDSLRDAMVREGAITPAAIRTLVREYARRFQEAERLDLMPALVDWGTTLEDPLPRLIENPPVRRFLRAPGSGGIEPLRQFPIEQKGLDESRAAFLLVGLPTAPESVPVIVNVTTGQAIVYLGEVAAGERLWIAPDRDGLSRASLEGADVSDRLQSIADVVPGEAWRLDDVETPAQAITLARGRNDLWFLPLAHYGQRGLDRFLLALADLSMTQGRFDETRFDHSLFYQHPAARLHVSWLETQPATFRAEVPGGRILSRAGRREEAIAARDQLASSLDLGVKRIRAAGVDGSATLMPFASAQHQMDRLTLSLPIMLREGGSSGRDRLRDAGAAFDVTAFDDSSFR